MKTFTLFLLVIWVTSAASAQTVSMNQGGTAASHYYEEIPYETAGSKIFVYVTIGGGRHKFLFDTGAPMHVSPSLAATAGATELNRMSMQDATGIRDSITTVRLKDIQLGQIDFHDVPAIEFTPDFYSCYGVDGVLGSNILRNSIIEILPSRHVIILTDDVDRLSLKKRNGTPLYSDEGPQSYPHIKVIFKGVKNVAVDLGFDTGGDDFITMPEDYLRQLSAYQVCVISDRGFGNRSHGEFGLGKPDSTYRVLVPSMLVADATFENATAETVKEGMPRLGARLLLYGSVTLDYIHHKFYFSPTQDKVDIRYSLWPLNPVIQNDHLFVGVVWSKMKDLLKPGEQIVGFGDVPTAQTPLCTWLMHSPLEDLTGTVVLKVKGVDGSIRDVSMTKE